MITITSLVHPTMIVKIRNGLKYAALGQGEKMNGHGNRVYIANRKGHNILRIDWKGNGKFIAYGGADWGQTDVTEIVKAAIQRGCSASRVKPRALSSDVKPSHKASTLVKNLGKALAIVAVVFLAGPSETSKWTPNPQAMEQACNKNPQMLICQANIL